MPTFLIEWTRETPPALSELKQVTADAYGREGREFFFYRNGVVVERLPIGRVGVRSVTTVVGP
jgi:hypothetical protein